MAKKIDVNSLCRLNYCAFEHVVRPRCHGIIEYINETSTKVRTKTGFATVDLYVLLRAGFTSEDWVEYFGQRNSQNVRDLLSRMRNTNDNSVIPKYIVDAYSENEIEDKDRSENSESDVRNASTVIERTRDHFKSKLMPLLNDNDRTLVIRQIMDIIARDETLPRDVRNALVATYESGDNVTFLARSFIVSITRDRLIEYKEPAKTPNPKYELYPRVEQVILEMQQFHNCANYEGTLKWLADTIADAIENSSYEDIDQSSWNAVAFWEGTHKYVRVEELNSEYAEFYEYIKKRAYLQEFHEVERYLILTVHKFKNDYGSPGEVSIKFAMEEDGAWRLDLMNGYLGSSGEAYTVIGGNRLLHRK